MDPNELTATISALAITVANKLSDDELIVLATIINQFKYTIESVIVQRRVCNKRYERLNKL